MNYTSYSTIVRENEPFFNRILKLHFQYLDTTVPYRSEISCTYVFIILHYYMLLENQPRNQINKIIVVMFNPNIEQVHLISSTLTNINVTMEIGLRTAFALSC